MGKDFTSVGKCGFDCAECMQSELNCDGNYKYWDRKPKYNINFITFQPYFDVTMGREVQSKHEITEFCKRNDMVYAGDKELSQQCKQNKQENEAKQEKAFTEGLKKELGRIL